jgi:hypothetical protein
VKKEKSGGIMHSFPKRVKGIATSDCGMAAGALCYRTWEVSRIRSERGAYAGDAFLAMSRERRVGFRDLVALVLLLAFVFVFGMTVMLLLGFTIAPLLLGAPGQPVSHGIEISLFLMMVVTSFPVGGLIGGLIWVAVMALVLRRDTVLRLLYLGPQLPVLTELCVSVLDAVSGHGRGSET